MNPTFSLGIPHAPWLPGRPAALERLFTRLGPLPGEYAIFSDKEPNHAWSKRMWDWAIRGESSHFLTLQDDAIVCEGFWDNLAYWVKCYPNSILALHCPHPAGPAALADGCSPLIIRDMLVGVAYCLPTKLLVEFLAWCKSLRSGWEAEINEDSLLAMWASISGNRIVAPLPSLVTHDTSLVSGYANDHDKHRISPTFTPQGNLPDVCPSDVGAFYATSMVELYRKWDPASSSKITNEWLADDGRRELRRLSHAQRAKDRAHTGATLFVATPTRGPIQAEYAASLMRLLNHVSVDITGALEVTDLQLWHEDVVRIRNRFVWYFLHKTEATHLFFVDSDISFGLETVTGMVAAKRDMVACPYPRRDTIDLQRVYIMRETDATVPPEAAAYRYSIRITKDLVMQEVGVCEIDGIGLGCAMISRALLQRMWDNAHNNGHWYTDTVPSTGEVVGMANLFGLLEDEGALLSEDFSFCKRLELAGEKVWMYLGHGSPVTHHGEWAYKGTVESFGFRRLPKT